MLYTFLIYILYAFYILFIYFLYTFKVKMEIKKWSSEKLKMVKKHFFPEMFGDLWGVICYHHWYPRAGLEGREKSDFSKKVLRLKKMQNYPLSIFHVAVRPESLPGADLSTFHCYFGAYFGPFRAQFGPFTPGSVKKSRKNEKWLFWGRPLSFSGSEYTIRRIFLRPIRW